MADQSREPTRQASQSELAQARELRITHKRHPLDDPISVQIHYDSLGPWIAAQARRASASVPLQRCRHCGEYPVSGVEWRPWHPHFALLCSRCRSTVYLMAERLAIRTGRRMLDTLTEVVAVLHLGE